MVRLELTVLSTWLRIAACAAILFVVAVGLPPRAEADTITAPPRGQAGDLWADKIIGQPDFSEIMPFETRKERLWLPHGVIVDSSNPGDERIYVYDGGNSRVLGIRLADCYTAAATASSCGEAAELHLGQPDFDTSACNGDSAYQSYPKRARASAATLCGMQEAQLSVTEGGSGSSMAVDADGNLYVTDFWNHRVLRFDDPFAPGEDLAADDVWGQANYFDNDCNDGRGPQNADADSLCFSWGSKNNWTAGVDLDASGNLWVVDSGNHRVLRFPAGQKTADIVLGHDTFTQGSPAWSCSNHYSQLDRLSHPSGVRVVQADIPDPLGDPGFDIPEGRVYVSDKGCARILYYDPPYDQPGTVLGGPAIDADPSLRPPAPPGVDFDPTRPGTIWVPVNRTWELWDMHREQPVLDTSGIPVRIGIRGNGNILGDATGSLGIDQAGNILVAIGVGSYDNDVLKFEPNGLGGYTGPTRLFHMNQRELTAADIAGEIQGVEVYTGGSNDQLIVAERGGRVLYWSQGAAPTLYDALSNHKPADGAIGGDFNAKILCCWSIEASDGHLWTTGGAAPGSPTLAVRWYCLPLPSACGENVLPNSLPLLGGGTIDLNDPGINGKHLWGMAAAPDDSFLWLSQAHGHRVVRVRDPLTNPVVDVVLGQETATGLACNQGGLRAFDTLCEPGPMALDRDGNLYVSDHSLEIVGNRRLLRFEASLFSNLSTTLFAPFASQELNTRATWEPAFDAAGHMVVGYNPYAGGVPFPCPSPSDHWNYWGSANCAYFPGVYLGPQPDGTQDARINDFHSMGMGMAFDDQNNLYIGDHNRTRVLVYRNPFAQSVGGIAELPDAAPARALATGDAHRGAGIAYVLIAATLAAALASAWVVLRRRRRARL